MSLPAQPAVEFTHTKTPPPPWHGDPQMQKGGAHKHIDGHHHKRACQASIKPNSVLKSGKTEANGQKPWIRIRRVT